MYVNVFYTINLYMLEEVFIFILQTIICFIQFILDTYMYFTECLYRKPQRK